MAAPTQEEIIVLKEFRKRISDIQLKTEQATDLKLLGWLRARDLDISKANEMLRASLEWRAANDIDNILSWKPPAHYSKEYDFAIVGKDADARPIGIAPIGVWDIRKAVCSSQKEKETWLRYMDQVFGIIFESMKEGNPGREVTQFVLILDFADFSIRQLTSFTSVDSILEVVRRFEAHYPESLYTCYIVNASRIFTMLFALVKPLLTARTLSKVQIYGSPKKWKPVLLENLPRDQLPVEFGGCKVGRRVSIGLSPHEDLGMKEGIDYVNVVVGAGQVLKLEFQVVHPNTKLIWKFKTENYDIGFYLNYNKLEDVLPNKKYDSIAKEEVGSYICERPGEYFLVFDNTYSKLRGKSLTYFIDILDPEEEVWENAED